MQTVELTKSNGLSGEVVPPPDKSISHRTIMFASLAEGKSVVRNFLRAEDPLSTIRAFRMLGVNIIEDASGEIIIEGKGIRGLAEPFDVVDCGNSGTTIRLLSGVLAGNPFLSVLTGDDSLKQRPMARVINPLKQMGASIFARGGDRYPPLAIRGAGLKAIDYTMPVASAQVKSCIMLAGLFANGVTVISEPQKSRDHTERMLAAMGAEICVDGLRVSVKGNARLRATDVAVPSDFSSAAFFIAGALLVPNSEVLIRGVGMNPTRTGLLKVLADMGAEIKIENSMDVSGEPVADIVCSTAPALKAVKIGGDIVPSLIDEFPILCILASCADGVTEIRGAQELRVKESDRIKAMATELAKLGVEVREYPDGMDITGNAQFSGGRVESYGDHRIAMSLSIAALLAHGPTVINNASCADISFPGFFEKLRGLEA
ncbi:MAG TPA: 3-phosphoshikimate 1-carboxyvinyltransferase [Dissulfurispiraceae bacterium]|nr:3-phosphoshikimate 1-carboxyvinyltransferase [Dissulfurispiraceae bacterium]